MKVGDLVVVVKPISCCNATIYIGRVFIVRGINERGGICQGCGARHVCKVAVEGNMVFEVSRLRVIPPLKELETVAQTEQCQL